MTPKPVGQSGHQITRFRFMNCYLVEESDGLTLVDTAISAATQIAEAARALNRGPIRRILLTHAHMDHVGSLDALCQPHSDHAAHIGGAVGTPPEVAISQRESRLLSKPPNLATDPGEPPCKLRGGYPGALTRPTRLLTPGELYGSLRCIPTPGHTPGHFSFLDERDGTLYTGDALVTVGGQPHVPGFGPWFFPFPKFATWDRPLSVASVRKLLELPIARLAPGHGAVLEGGSKLIEQALAETS
jgi:glyoxylase-like metal-dependent hydrolase (beta-lactamase superfamily II)